MKEKFNSRTITVCIILLVMAILTIVGISIDYLSYKVTFAGTSQTTTFSLNAEEISELSGYGAMSAFAYITLVLAIINLIVYIVSILLDMKILKLVLRIVSILLIISSIVAVVTTFLCGESTSNSYYVALFMPAMGSLLLTVSGIISGAVALVTSKSKKK